MDEQSTAMETIDANNTVVSIGVVTYNHDRFIRECLDSILSQDLDYDFEVVIGDDCSTDSTPMILSEYHNRYPDRIVLVYNSENVGISENYKKVLSRCKGKYIALCEGDDYWTDKDKLTKQISFLDTHQEYGFVGTYSRFLFPDGHYEPDPYDYFPQPETEGDWELHGDVFKYAINGPVTRTVSICFRKSLILPYLNIPGTGNDLVLQTILAKYSLFAKHKGIMTVYRQGGISNDRYNWDKQLYYNRWIVFNRLLQKELFPNDINWDTDELMDREKYILLKKYIMEFKWREARESQRSIVSSQYKRKSYCRYLRGPISFLVLSLKLRLSNNE